MPKSPTIILDDVNKANLTKLFGETGVTMIRLAKKNKEFAQNLQFLVSARLERDGTYNIREARKVIHRGYNRDQAVDFLEAYARNLNVDASEIVVFGVIRDFVTKAKPTVSDVLSAIKQPV